MNDILLLLWLGEFASALSNFLSIIAFSLLMASIINIAHQYFEYVDKEDRNYTLPVKILMPAFIVVSLISCVIPSKQWFYIAAGGSAAVKAMDSEIGKKVQVLVNNKLDEALNEGVKNK